MMKADVLITGTDLHCLHFRLLSVLSLLPVHRRRYCHRLGVQHVHLISYLEQIDSFACDMRGRCVWVRANRSAVLLCERRSHSCVLTSPRCPGSSHRRDERGEWHAASHALLGEHLSKQYASHHSNAALHTFCHFEVSPSSWFLFFLNTPPPHSLSQHNPTVTAGIIHNSDPFAHSNTTLHQQITICRERKNYSIGGEI